MFTFLSVSSCMHCIMQITLLRLSWILVALSMHIKYKSKVTGNMRRTRESIEILSVQVTRERDLRRRSNNVMLKSVVKVKHFVHLEQRKNNFD